jgi:hypothetical protein
MQKIDKQQNVTVQNILRCLNELNDENMVYVGSQPPTETKKGLIWINPEELSQEPEVRYVGHMVGDIYPISYTELEEGQIILKGQLVSRQVYQVLWNWVEKHPSLLKTEQEWNEYFNNTNGLCCPYFSYGTNDTNFRLPNYSGVFIRADADITKINQFSEDTQRNITGSVNEDVMIKSASATGAISITTLDSTYPSTANENCRRAFWDFDASRSVRAEHTGNEVKPKSINQIWVIQAVGVITNASNLDISQLEEAIQQLTNYSNYEVACIKNNPNYYNRDELFTTNKTTVTIPKDLKININGNCYISTINKSLQLSTVDTPANLAGKDVYIYACEPTSGTEPIFVLSLNSTVPTGYTANNSRKIGGFHCLCKDVGVIEGHTLSGYVTGDILPATRWDLLHRPKGEPEGFAYEELTDCWIAIYLPSWDGTKLVSVYNGVIADGTSTKKWHGEAFYEQFAKQGMRLVWRHEFQMGAKGSNEQTNIQGSSDPNTTGGHVDTAGRRMISNIGLEDCCGVLWQFAMDLGFAGGSGWTNSAYNSNVDDRSYGQTYGTLYRLLLGAHWVAGGYSGSRSAGCNSSSAAVYVNHSARGASEPKTVKGLN